MNDNLTAYRSSDFDSNVGKTIPYYGSFHNETIRLIEAYNPNPTIWIDTGAGTGTLVGRAHSRFPNTEFFLADPSQAMLAVAKEKLGRKNRITILSPVGSDKLDVPARADVITAIQSHHYMNPDDRRAAIRNCCRLLNKGGIFVTFENIKPMTAEGIEIGKNNWRRFQIEQGRKPEEVQANLERFGVEYFPLTIEEHLELLRSCPFKAVEVFWFSVMQAGFYCIK